MIVCHSPLNFAFSVKVIFIPKYVSRVVFKGDILGGLRQFWGNPYLNSTTVLFDNTTIINVAYSNSQKVFDSCHACSNDAAYIIITLCNGITPLQDFSLFGSLLDLRYLSV